MLVICILVFKSQSAKRHLQDVLKMSYQDKQDIFKRREASPRKFLWGFFVKSWTSYPGKYLNLSEGATKTK